MRVIRARTMGFCMGVSRAMKLAEETASASPGRRVYTIGPLIHNPQAVAALADLGVRELSDADAVEGSGVDLRGTIGIVRAHGIPPALRERLEARGMELVDATCPRVLASQRKARDFASRGYRVILVGDRNHGEMEGIAGYAPGCAVIGTPAEAAALDLDRPCAAIAQTTVRREEYDAVCAAIRARRPDLEVVDSICSATRDRQEALSALLGECDAVVVVGGKGSANTRRLWQAALDAGVEAHMVETAGELPASLASKARVGVTAGASTPDFVVDAVALALEAMGEGR